MPRFIKAELLIHGLVAELIATCPTHKPLLDTKLRLDIVFAFGDQDDQGNLLNDALVERGLKILGITKKTTLKERVLGRGDAEITLDGDYWKDANEEQRHALLDHELQHITVKTDKAGNFQYDDIGNTQVHLRHHDVDIGWFKDIAIRHGLASQERIQAANLMLADGQYYWPELTILKIVA